MMTALKQQPHQLTELLYGFANVPAEVNRTVDGLCLDSRKVKAGDLFFAVQGLTHDAAVFIDAVIDKGAVAVVWETEAGSQAVPLSWRQTSSGNKVPLITMSELSTKMGYIADRFYDSPSKDIFVIGITGTNGKTSCGQYLAQMLSDIKPCGVMGTLGAGIYGQLEDTAHTTPDALRCHSWLAEMRDTGVNQVTMEVSSHALDQGRVNGIGFDCAVFTNLTQDHLDYHGDLDSYAQTKYRLFKTPELQHAVINVDDEFGRELVTKVKTDINIIRYGLDASTKPDVYGYDLALDLHGFQMNVDTPWGNGRIQSTLMGRFNASNVLAVLSVMLITGMPFEKALTKVQSLSPVPGRMECVGGGKQPLVVVDYAHTPDALEQVLSTLREHCEGELFSVFGCGGDRDKGKRALMGKVAEQFSDHIILTNDNPRTEDAILILDDIQQGIRDTNKTISEPDREKAISMAIEMATAKDIVLIAGKGHEDYQILGTEKRFFSDLEQTIQCLGLI